MRQRLQIHNRVMPLVIVKVWFPLNILWMYWWNLIKFCMCIDLNLITDWYASIFANLQQNYGPWCCQNFVSTQYHFEQYWSNFAYALIITRSRLGLLCVKFCNLQQIMALDYGQNFVFAQYLENELIKLDQSLHMHWPWPDLCRDC